MPIGGQVVDEQTRVTHKISTTNQTPPTNTEAFQTESRDCSSNQKSAKKRKQTRKEHKSEA